MSPFVAALIYAWVAHCLAFLVTPRSIPLDERLRAFLAWAASAAAFFLLRDPVLVLVVVAVILIALAPSNASARAAFFLIAAPVIPNFLELSIPFPGLNFLATLSSYKLIAIVLLLPIFMLPSPSDTKKFTFTASDACLILYISYTSIHSIFHTGLTIGLRFMTDQILIFALPYFGLRRALRSIEDIETALRSILICAIILASISLVVTWKQWEFYYFMDSDFVPYSRAGRIRTNATMNPSCLAFLIGLGLVALEFSKRQLQLKRSTVTYLHLIFLGGMYFTQARGALLGVLLGFLTYSFVSANRPQVRWVYAMAVFSGFLALSLTLLLSNFSENTEIEAADSIDYRQNLLSVSIKHIMQYPIFGDHYFYSRPEFEPLRQGQGIIDITNLYLQVGLHFGLIGLALFFVVFIYPALRALNVVFRSMSKINIPESTDQKLSFSRGSILHRAERSGALSEDYHEQEIANLHQSRRLSGVVTGMLLGWLFLISTISDVSLVIHMGIVSVTLVNAFLRIKVSEASPSKITIGDFAEISPSHRSSANPAQQPSAIASDSDR